MNEVFFKKNIYFNNENEFKKNRNAFIKTQYSRQYKNNIDKKSERKKLKRRK